MSIILGSGLTYGTGVVWGVGIGGANLGTRSSVRTDPLWSDVTVLASFDGVDGATAPTNLATPGGTFSATGNAQLDTAQKRFGTASALFDGTGDYFSLADSTSPAFGSGEFCVEAWVRFNTLATTEDGNCIAAQYIQGTNQRSWAFIRNTVNGKSELDFIYSTTGSDAARVVGDWTPTVGVWYFVVAERTGTTLRLWAGPVGGTMSLINSGTVSATFFASSAGLDVGFMNTLSGSRRYMNGWIDELRITKGASRYGASVVQPLLPFPTS